ncbi:RNA-directed DNA polymerase, eukaryota [Tanacetum coccineum]
MIIGSININGVGTVPKKEWARDLCRENHLNFIGIQETKTNKEDLNFILSLWGKNNCDFAVTKSCGSSGGIIAIWDSSLFKKRNVINNEDGFIAIIGDWINIGIECLMIVVYAPQDVNKKILLWNQMNHLILNIHEHGRISKFKVKISMFDTKAEHGSLGEHEIVERLNLLKKIEDLDHLKRLDQM